MTAPWQRVVPPLLGVLALLGLCLWLAGQLGLVDWGSARGFGWSSLLFAFVLVPPVVVERTYPVLREPRLYLLVFLLLPLGLVQLLYDTRLLETWGWLAAEAPDLQADLAGPLGRLCALTFFLAPLAVLAATPLARGLTRQRLRRITALFLGGELLLGLVWLLVGPDHAPQGAWACRALLVPSAAAAGVALVLWRSQAGLGGAVAGLVVWIAAAGLAHLGEDLRFATRFLYEDLRLIPADQVDAASFPPGSGRLLLQAFPGVLAAVVAYEWVVNLSHRTSHDALTQIYNKAYAEAIVSQTTTTRLGEQYSVAIVDIDHFKRVNDTFGHAVGDVVLQEVARVIRDAVGGRGVVCRTGGEEITVFYPGLPLEAAREVCEEVRRAVKGHTVRVRSAQTRKRKVEVTLSVGVASNIDEHGEPIHAGVAEVVEAADRAVYAAKRRGRNRVVTMLKE